MPNIGNASVYANNLELRVTEQCLRMEIFERKETSALICLFLVMFCESKTKQ